MFSYALATGEDPLHSCLLVFNIFIPFTASTYFHLPIDEEEDRDIDTYQRKCLTWVAEPSECSSSYYSKGRQYTDHDCEGTAAQDTTVIHHVLTTNDLYHILSISKNAPLDKLSLRRAYLLRSKACHPEYVAYACGRLFYLPYSQ